MDVFSPHTRGCSPCLFVVWQFHLLFPAYAGVIPAWCVWQRLCIPFPRIRGDYQKTPRKVLRERLKKVPIKQTNRPGFHRRKPGRFCMQEAGARAVPPTCAFLHFRENAQTKSRQCRGKEEESDTACCIGTPEHCGLVRRDLVVCPPFWLLPRIETGDSFLWACCAPLLRPHPQGNVPAWAFAGRTFRRLWGMSVPFSLSAPLLCQTIVAILCGNFEQFANKRPAHKKDC